MNNNYFVFIIYINTNVKTIYTFLTVLCLLFRYFLTMFDLYKGGVPSTTIHENANIQLILFK
jgi:hypothetical protein